MKLRVGYISLDNDDCQRKSLRLGQRIPQILLIVHNMV